MNLLRIGALLVIGGVAAAADASGEAAAAVGDGAAAGDPDRDAAGDPGVAWAAGPGGNSGVPFRPQADRPRAAMTTAAARAMKRRRLMPRIRRCMVSCHRWITASPTAAGRSPATAAIGIATCG